LGKVETRAFILGANLDAFALAVGQNNISLTERGSATIAKDKAFSLTFQVKRLGM
jgi:hypothetical protein